MKHWWTDYPLYESECGKKAPKRQIKILAYDGDKYCTIEFNGEQFQIKTGYIYPKPERFSTKNSCKRFIKLLNRLEKLNDRR
jgi:hypothetical protein